MNNQGSTSQLKSNAQSAGINFVVPELRIDWCAYEAAKFAVEHWHYSKCLPRGKNIYVGVWESQRFIGSVIFGTGAGNITNGKRFGLREKCEVVELVRVALNTHATPVSRIVSISLKFLKRNSPGIRLVISLADPLQDHIGTIYQAGNWIYAGTTTPTKGYIDSHGLMHHARTVSESGIKLHYGRPLRVLKPSQCKEIDLPGKHKYFMPLDSGTREVIEKLRKPYPKRPIRDAAGHHPVVAAQHRPGRSKIPNAKLARRSGR